MPSRQTKKQMKMEKNNSLTSPSLKAADALKFTRQGLPCSRQWGGEGGCSSAPQACSQGLHLHVRFWHFYVSIQLLCRYLVQGAGFVLWSTCCEGESLVGGKQHAAQAICNLPAGQWWGAAARSISSWLHQFDMHFSVQRLQTWGCLSILPPSFFPWPRVRLLSLRTDTEM